jgi:hypothetical protein
MVIGMRAFGMGQLRVVCVEKTSTEERNASPGSITWVARGTTLLRCAPEQLRQACDSYLEVCQ